MTSSGRAPSGQAWQPVSGFEGLYSVSADGEVFSHRANKVLRSFNSKGYPAVSLKRGGDRKNGRIHLLVAGAFHGPRPAPNIECAHLDGDTQNPTAANLAWVTKAENEAHKKLHRTAAAGGRSPHAKLTDEQAAIARVAVQRPLTRRELSVLTGLGEASLYRLLNGSSYNA